MPFNTINRLEPKKKRDNMRQRRHKIGCTLYDTRCEVYVSTPSSLDGQRYSILLIATCDPLYHILILLRRNVRTIRELMVHIKH